MYRLFGRRRNEDVSDEIRSHLAMAERDYRERGLSPGEARARARREFGNVAHVTEATRAVWVPRSLDAVRQDLRYAIRGCRRQPVFALAAILALGGAIGLNTSIFTTFNAFFRAEWPVRDPGTVVQIRSQIQLDAPAYTRVAADATTLSGLVAVGCASCRVFLNGRDVRVNTVSANFFEVLGVPLAAGRPFGEPEGAPDAPAAVVVLSHRLWTSDFGANPDVVGRTIRLGDRPFTVLGVTDRAFTGIRIDDAPRLWVPLGAAPLLDVAPTAPAIRFLAGRLAESAAAGDVLTELNVLVGRERRGDPDRPLYGPAVNVRPATYVPLSKAQELTSLGLLSVAVLFVLLLACANVGNLLLARAAARTREIATRLSLGASRGRLVRQLMTESVVLAGAACALGLGLAFVLPGLVMRWIATAGERPVEFSVTFVPDLDVALFACALGATSVFAFGLAPALAASRVGISGALKETGGALGTRLGPRRFLLATQVAISAMLLVSAGLTARSVQRAIDVDLGFDMEHIAEVGIRTPAFYAEDRQLAVVRAFVDRATSIDPDTVAAWNQRFGYGSGFDVRPAGAPAGAAVSVVAYTVSPRFFDVMRVPIVAGRPAGRGTTDEVVVSESLARHLWSEAAALGRPIVVGEETSRVVGIARDADLMGVGFTSDFATSQSRMTVYAGLTNVQRGARVLVRLDAPGRFDALESLVAEIDPVVALEIRPLTETRRRRLAENRVGAALAGLLGAMALAIATIGISGVFGFVTAQRSREIGIRLALGGRRSQVIGSVLASSSRGLVVGLAIGLIGAAAASPLLAGYVHPDVGPVDPLAYAGVALVLAAAGAIAALAPARRASRIDPAATLRAE